MAIRNTVTALLLSLALAVSGGAHADSVTLNPDHPERYTVVKGDTLWDISARFLRDPWRWPDVWDINPQIDNPHLIYPGDTISLTYREGQPVLQLERPGAQSAAMSGGDANVVKLSPQVRISKLERPIPTIPVDAIQQFLLNAHVISQEELDKSGYVVSMEEGRLIAGTGNKIYARDIHDRSASRYQVFRTGTVYRNLNAKKDDILGYEALGVADARVEAFGDPATLAITKATRETLIGDRLIPVPEDAMQNLNFVPSAPDKAIEGNIVALFDAISRAGRYQVVVLNLGHNDGIRPGNVLAAFHSGETVRDTVNTKAKPVELPDVQEGLMVVFRVFDKVSYALVMQATRDIRLYDTVRNP